MLAKSSPHSILPVQRQPRPVCRALLAAALLGPLSGFAAATPEPATVLADYFRQCHAVQVCNGSFLVVKGDEVLYEAALGDASADGAQALTPAHTFDIGSISKQFTAAAIVRLAEQQKLGLDDVVAKHLTDFPYPDMTLRQLLTHTSGVPDVMPYYSQLLRSGNAAGPVTANNVVQVLATKKLPPRFASGTRFEYSNTGYLLLAQVVAHASGQAYESYLDQEFFKPLGMASTRARLPDNDAQIQPRAYGFRVSASGKRQAFDQIPQFYMLGAGGIYSTAKDLQRWARALREGKVMNADHWKDATTPVRLNDGSSVPYSFGMGLRPSPLGQSRVSHSGHWRAFKADLTLLPAQALDIILLTNNGEDDSVDHARDAVEAIVAGKPYAMVKESIHLPLTRRLQADDADALRKWLNDERHASPLRYTLLEDKVNELGYALLERKEIDKAIVLMEFNRDVHPTSMNAYDSLADAYLAKGDRDAAIEQVRKMIALKPDSKPAQEKLKKLLGAPEAQAE